MPESHIETVIGLSRPGQALGMDAPTASIKNSQWFTANGKPRRQRLILHRQLLNAHRANTHTQPERAVQSCWRGHQAQGKAPSKPTCSA